MQQDLYGIYRGLITIDNPETGWGEISLVVAVDAITIFVATGQEVKKWYEPMSDIRELSREQILAMDMERSHDSDTISVRAFVLRDVGVTVLFVVNDGFLDGAIIRGVLGRGIFGPATLFPPLSVEVGDFDRALERQQADFGNAIPVLEYGGRAPRDG